jgi:hypothetical protein
LPQRNFMKDAAIVSAVRTEKGQPNRVVWCCCFFLWLGAFTVPSVVAQSRVQFIPNRSGEQVKIVYGGKSARVKMEDEADLPGNPSHRYQVLFTTVKDKQVYLLVRVCSKSPMPNPMGPCGGDQPCALLWIKADEALDHREIKSEIFASCSYNYSQVGKTRVAGGKLVIVYQDTSHKGIKTELTYDNSHPDQGIQKRQL